MLDKEKNKYKVIIIGTGFSGIATAIKLQEQNITDFILIDREKEMGGTWWRNNYPGAAVDVESVFYSFSFEHKNWSRAYAKQSEILEYTNEVIQKYGLRKKAITSANVSHVAYHAEENEWTVAIEDGREYKAKYVVNAIGHLSQPVMPNIPGKDTFKGASFHTARWNHDVDYKGKRVGIIGTGASGLQVAPAIADDVTSLTMFQRTPQWIMPRHDRAFSERERKLFSIPIVAKIRRFIAYWAHEYRVIAFQYYPSLIKKVAQTQALKHLSEQVADEGLRKTLTPKYTIGCKRILISNEYYPALQKDNVAIETSGIHTINETGILAKDGTQIELDLLVYATGFHAFSSNACLPFDIIGRDNTSLRSLWEKNAHAYVGVSIPKYPNLFHINGPNTGIGHTSAIFMSESQVAYIIDTIKYMEDHKKSTVEIKEKEEADYNLELKKHFKNSVWRKGGCDSWYNGADGTNTTIYPTFTFIFQNKTKKFRPHLHVVK